MDLDVIGKHIELIEKHYPGINIVQMGIVALLLGSLRATMGHEYSTGALDNYIHVKHLKPKIKQCYYNSQMLALQNPRILYYEGFANSKVLSLPLEHAFNVIDNKVVDVTWKDGKHYFGIYIPTDFIRKNIFKTGEAQQLITKYIYSQLKK